MRTLDELLEIVNKVDPPRLQKSPRPRRTPATILSIDPDYDPESEDLETLQLFVNKKISEWEATTRDTNEKHLLIVATGAGTGKTTATNLILRQYIDISPTTQLAEEKYLTVLNNNVKAIIHRSRLYNVEAAEHHTPDTVPIGLDASKGEVPCAHPHICNALAAKDYPPVHVFCQPKCQRFIECNKHGYLSQWELMKKHDAIFFSYDDGFFSDPKYLTHINNITGGNPDYIFILDEVSPEGLPPKRKYNTKTLQRLAEAHRGTLAGTFLQGFIKETSIATSPIIWARIVGKQLSQYTPEELDTIDFQLQGIPAYVSFKRVTDFQLNSNGLPLYTTFAHINCSGKKRTCAVISHENVSVFETFDTNNIGWISDEIYPTEGWKNGEKYYKPLSLKTYCRLYLGTMNTIEEFEILPPILSNFTADLRAFAETVNSDTPACHEIVENEAHVGWTYYLRPQLNARRNVITSASGIVDIIKELYCDTVVNIDVIEAKPPAWKTGTRFVQISTGRYTPARSLLKCDKTQNYKPIGLQITGKEMLQIIATEAALGKPTLVVGPKAITVKGELAHLPEIQAILNMDNVWVINHYLAEGINEYSHCKNAFIFHFEPRPNEIMRTATLIYRNQTLSDERILVTLKKGGVVLERVWRYKDPAVQTIFDKECEKRLMQALARLRSMINEGCNIYVLSSEPISGVPQLPILCNIKDMQNCQTSHRTLEKLEVYLELQTSRTVKEVMEQNKVSEREAYRITKEQRKAAKQELYASIVRMHDAGSTPKEIWEHFKAEIKSLKTIYNILNRANCKN